MQAVVVKSSQPKKAVVVVVAMQKQLSLSLLEIRSFVLLGQAVDRVSLVEPVSLAVHQLMQHQLTLYKVVVVPQEQRQTLLVARALQRELTQLVL